MMIPEQRYLFDLNGYLHLEQALNREELSAAQAAAERYIHARPEDLPPDFGTENGRIYEHGFAFDKALEKLVFHPSYWPIIKEFTDNKPRFSRGTMLVNQPGGPVEAGSLHCARESYGWQSTRYDCRDGRIYCDDFVVFPYLYDVHPGDGGLVVLPGSHKCNFDRPDTLFQGGRLDEGPPPGVVNLSPKAGDVIIISELLTHGGLEWKPIDRNRVVLVLRYAPQYRGGPDWVPDSLKKRLSPETIELMAPGSYTDLKAVVQKDTVTLSE
jgi:hypothetical protein